MPHAADTTSLLVALRKGTPGALDELLPRVYGELCSLAHRQLAGRGAAPTLSTAGLVHEVYLKLVDQTRVGVTDRAHFLALSARAMRQVVIDFARGRGALKRGGDWVRVTLTDPIDTSSERMAGLVELDEALERLRRFDERLHQVVEYRYFGGLTVQETAAAMQVGPRTVDRLWQKARSWLHHEMHEAE